MYNIAAREISMFNGLGEGGALWNSWGKDLVKIGVDAGTKIAETAIKSKNENKNAAGGDSSTYSPTVYVPPTGGTTGGTTSQSSGKSFMDYMPWIIGGIGVLGLGYLILKK